MDTTNGDLEWLADLLMIEIPLPEELESLLTPARKALQQVKALAEAVGIPPAQGVRR